MKDNIEVKPPNISEETMRKMSEFFSKTSHPRMVVEMKKQEENENE